jgi:eukaryotic-like serine/threonine-protein kinase
VNASQAATPDRDRDPLEGTPYRVIQRLGAGGMGEVYEAEHTALGKRVVIKLLHRYWTDDPVLVDRLRLEAQVLARLDHPNLVQVADFGQTPGGRPYFVMERLVGRTLRAEQKERGALPVVEAMELAREILLGLEAAHRHGIVHRDVKLENVFLCDPPPGLAQPWARGRRVVKVLDFGIAKVIEGAQSDRAPKPLIRPTEVGMSIGTPRFFSPEQARGEAVDARADLYAVGAVLYALLTGHGPFDHHRGLAAICRAHASEPPRPPSAWRGDVPPELDAIALTALAKRPEDRFQCARGFAAALAAAAERLRASPPRPPAPPPSPPPRHTMWLAPIPQAAVHAPAAPVAAPTRHAVATTRTNDTTVVAADPAHGIAAAVLVVASAAVSAILTVLGLLEVIR